MATWLQALKEYAKAHGKYIVPKKGSAEYEAVRKLMGAAPAATASAAAPAAEKKARKPRAKKAAVVAAHKAEGEVLKEAEKAHAAEGAAIAAAAPRAAKKRMPRKKRAAAPVAAVEIASSNAVEAKPKRRRARAKAGSVPVGLLPEGATEAAVAASKNPSAVLESATNAHMPVVPAESMVKLRPVKNLKGALKKVEKPDLPRLVKPTAEVSAPAFSFQAVRNLLGA